LVHQQQHHRHGARWTRRRAGLPAAVAAVTAVPGCASVGALPVLPVRPLSPLAAVALPAAAPAPSHRPTSSEGTPGGGVAGEMVALPAPSSETTKVSVSSSAVSRPPGGRPAGPD